jgi:hypothetical protein
MKPRGTRTRWVLLLMTLLTSTASRPAVPAVVGVSPGAADRFAQAPSACPTFSWTAAPGTGYRLAVYAVSEDLREVAQPALSARLPSSATTTQRPRP